MPGGAQSLSGSGSVSSQAAHNADRNRFAGAIGAMQRGQREHSREIVDIPRPSPKRSLSVINVPEPKRTRGSQSLAVITIPTPKRTRIGLGTAPVDDFWRQQTGGPSMAEVPYDPERQLQAFMHTSGTEMGHSLGVVPRSRSDLSIAARGARRFLELVNVRSRTPLPARDQPAHKRKPEMVTRRDANELIRDESGALIQDKWQDFVETHKPGLRVRQLTRDERDRERDRHIGDERRRHARDTQRAVDIGVLSRAEQAEHLAAGPVKFRDKRRTGIRESEEVSAERRAADARRAKDEEFWRKNPQLSREAQTQVRSRRKRDLSEMYRGKGTDAAYIKFHQDQEERLRLAEEERTARRRPLSDPATKPPRRRKLDKRPKEHPPSKSTLLAVELDRHKQHDPPPAYAPPTGVPFDTQLAQQTEQGDILAAKLAGRVAHKPVSISPSPDSGIQGRDGPGYMQAGKVHRKRALEEDVEVGVDEPTTDPKSPKRAKSGKEWDAQQAEEDRLFKVIKAKHLAKTQLELEDVNYQLQQARAAKQRMYEEGEMKLREIDEHMRRGRAVRSIQSNQAIAAIFQRGQRQRHEQLLKEEQERHSRAQSGYGFQTPPAPWAVGEKRAAGAVDLQYPTRQQAEDPVMPAPAGGIAPTVPGLASQSGEEQPTESPRRKLSPASCRDCGAGSRGQGGYPFAC